MSDMESLRLEMIGIAVCTVAPHEEVIAKATDLDDGGAFIATQLHGQPRH